MHELTIARSRYLTEDSIASAVLAVAASVLEGGVPVTVEFPISPRTAVEDADAVTYVRVQLTTESAVSSVPSDAPGSADGLVGAVRMHASSDENPRFTHAREQTRLRNERDTERDTELDDLGYEMM